MITTPPTQGDRVIALPNFGFSELFYIGGSSWIYYCRTNVFRQSSLPGTVFSATDFAGQRDKYLCHFTARRYA